MANDKQGAYRTGGSTRADCTPRPAETENTRPQE